MHIERFLQSLYKITYQHYIPLQLYQQITFKFKCTLFNYTNDSDSINTYSSNTQHLNIQHAKSVECIHNFTSLSEIQEDNNWNRQKILIQKLINYNNWHTLFCSRKLRKVHGCLKNSPLVSCLSEPRLNKTTFDVTHFYLQIFQRFFNPNPISSVNTSCNDFH